MSRSPRDVSDNTIISLPDSFTTLSALTHFDASNNNLTGVVPPSLLASASIVNVNLANNALTGDVSVTSPSLYSLSLDHNALSGITVQSASRLSKVYLASNGFKGTLPDLSASTGLSTFDASFNKLVALPQVKKHHTDACLRSLYVQIQERQIS